MRAVGVLQYLPVALVGPQRIAIDTGIGCFDTRRSLIDVLDPCEICGA